MRIEPARVDAVRHAAQDIGIQVIADHQYPAWVGPAHLMKGMIDKTGIGLGMAEPGTPAYGDFLRVAHMGHVNAHMTLGVLGAMETGLRALGVPHGPGALDAAAAALSGR